MDYHMGAFYVAIIIMLWVVIQDHMKEKKASFQNNDYYFQGNDNDSMYTGNLILPKLYHLVNIPQEW